MRKIVLSAFIIFLFLLTVSCASAPNWSGTETAAGEFVWSPSPGIRLYINIALLAALYGFFIFSVVWNYKNDLRVSKFTAGFMIIFIFALFGIGLFSNLRGYIWRESFSISAGRIERTFYPTIRKAEKEILEWKSVADLKYLPDQSIKHQHWIEVFRSTGEPTGRTADTGVRGKVITLSDNEGKKIEFLLATNSYDTTWLVDSEILGWIFGSTDFVVAPEDERRIKAAIKKFLPENVKEKMSEETRDYLSKQE
jgi:hypothetical protein